MFGVILTAVGESYADHAGDDTDGGRLGVFLAIVSAVAEVGRLLLLEHLLRRRELTVGGVFVYTAPLEIALLSLSAVTFELLWRFRNVELFDARLNGMLLLNTPWAIGTDVCAYCFVRVGSALLAACSAPFKDEATILVSDVFVETRHESRLSIFEYSVARVASFAYCVGKLGEDRREAFFKVEHLNASHERSASSSGGSKNSSKNTPPIDRERAPLLTHLLVQERGSSMDEGAGGSGVARAGGRLGRVRESRGEGLVTSVVQL
jgi:hypothetical protein